MKSTKLVLLSTLTFLIMSTAVLFTSCADPCSSVICKNNGICRDGACACAVGYEGPFCEDAMNKKFIGTWDGTYRCNGSAPLARTFIMQPGIAPNEVVIYDLFSQNQLMSATVSGTDITIPLQSNNGWDYRGYGNVEGLYITLFLEQRDPLGNFNSCIFNATKFQE